MVSEQVIEQHYQKLPSETLHILRDEYKWAEYFYKQSTAGHHRKNIKSSW